MTRDGEFDQVSGTVRGCIDRIEASRYFAPGTAAYFLEELAQHGPQPIPVSRISATPRWIWPADMPQADRYAAISTVLTDSGVGTVTDDRFQFVSPAVHQFLRAGHVAHKCMAGWPYWRIWFALKPRAQRDEMAELFMRFLVVLLWPVAQSAVQRRLKAFVARRHRYPNILFVADLCRRYQLAELGEQTAGILRQEVDTAKRQEHEWQELVEALRTLDPESALTALDQAIRAPGPRMSHARQLPVVIKQFDDDPARAAENLEYIAEHPFGPPEEQVEVAVGIREINPRRRHPRTRPACPDQSSRRVPGHGRAARRFAEAVP